MSRLASIRLASLSILSVLAALGTAAEDTAAGSVALKPEFAVQSSSALGTATSRGFECSTTYHWVRDNFPSMTSISGQIENVWFLSDLYQWNGTSWIWWMRRGLYQGAANANGSVCLICPYTTVFWQLNNSSVTAQGAVFPNVPPGYYTVVEYFVWDNGGGVASMDYRSGTNFRYCRV